MTTDEAFDYTMELVEELRGMGVKVEIKPSRSRTNAEVIAKYSGPERVKPERWVNVQFKAVTEEQANAIQERCRKLNWLGVVFDTGGGMKMRDWELDWSFRYQGRPDAEREEVQGQVEDLIQGMESGTLRGIPEKPDDD